MKIFSLIDFPKARQIRQVAFRLYYMLFENILHEFSWETISGASKTPINIAVQHFEQTNIYRDILLPRLGKNISMALQNMIDIVIVLLITVSLGLLLSRANGCKIKESGA